MEPKFWAAFCEGVGREELIVEQFAPPGSPAHRQLEMVFAARTRAEWSRFASEVDCCLEPVLEVDEALASELARERGMVVELEQPGVDGPVRALSCPVRLSRTPAEPRRLPAPGLGADTRAILGSVYTVEEVEELISSGAAKAADWEPTAPSSTADAARAS
ncbi:CoA transferase [Conexibacter sp. W3-3-2]|uniref:CoA transferase n=1 Tax=Conexibacter sp. W3-3-2 TaxID=2675227 RepID=UPI0018AA357E